MRDLYVPPPAPTPITHFGGSESVASSANGSVRHVSPEDVYDDRYAKQPVPRPQSHYDLHASIRQNERENQRFTQSTTYQSAPSSRQISTTSTATTTISGSENWESYASDEEEPHASDAYYAKLDAARGKRFTPDDVYPQGNAAKKQKGLPPYSHAGHAVTDSQGNRIVSGSEANWTDDDAF
jgi:protein regulator of cytokinesis 1